MNAASCVILGLWACLLGSAPAPIGSGGDVLHHNSRSVRIPVFLAPGGRSGLHELQLYASDDRGRTWRQVDAIPPDGEAFRFLAPHEGEFWFSVRVVRQDGTANPEEPSGLPATLKIRFGHEAAAGDGASVEGLRSEVESLRQRLRQVERRLSEIEAARGR